MAYTKTTWADRAVQFPNRYDKSEETSAQVTLTASPGTVTQTGTPLNAANMNKIEQAIADAAAGVDTANTHIAATSGVHGAVNTATANRIVIRDAAGRAQFTDPTTAADAATKGYTDTAVANARPYEKGMYTGDGSASRDIALPYTPSALLLTSNRGFQGLALNGSPSIGGAGAGNFTTLSVGVNKFTVYYDSANAVHTNDSGVVYHYIAFK